jgi:hypothetical protein
VKSFGFIVLPCLLLLSVSCNNCLGGSAPRSPVTTQTEIEGQRFLLKADDFDLENIIGLIKDSKLKDASELEKRINDGSGINNVDIDQDGVIDYIMVKESRGAKGITLDFLAVPSSIKDESRAETIASLTFSQNTSSKDVQVQGGYPAYVQGGENAYYSGIIPHGGMSFGDAFFLAWLFSPGRMMFYQPFMPMYYYPRPVVPYNQRAPRPRSSGFARAPRPSSYQIDSANLKSRSGAARPYGARSNTNPPRRATSFSQPTHSYRPSPAPRSPTRSFFRMGGRGFGGRRR